MKAKFRIILFAALLFSLSLFNITSPTRTFSDRENRFLEKFPDISLKNIVNGKFNDKFQTYSSDQFIFRDKWISLKTRIDLSFLKKDNGRVYFGHDDFLFDLDKPLNEKKFTKNMKRINSLNKSNNIPLDIMLIPSKSTIFTDKLPFKAPVIDEGSLLQDIESKLDKDIRLITPLESYISRKDEEIYYKTDHHYTSLGAYYAYREYMEGIGQEAYDLDYFERDQVTDKFLGSLFRKSSYYSGSSESIERFLHADLVDLEIIKNEKEELTSLYDESYLEKSDKYSYFLGGDHPLLDIKTSIDGKGTLLLVKDSFANSLIPFLTLHYDRIIVIDERYFNLPIEDYIKDIEVDRILFLYNIRTFYDK